MGAPVEVPAGRRRPSPLLVIFFTIFLDLLAFGMILPAIPFYAQHFGATEFGAGVLMASYSLGQFLFAPVWGRLSDRVGRRPVLLWSILVSAVSLTAFGLAQNYWWLLAARTFAGVAAANISTAQAYVADVTSPENRSKGMGAVGAAIGLGFVFGPGFGGFLGQYGLAVPAFVAAGLSLVNFVVAWFILTESRERHAWSRERRIRRPSNPVIALLVGVGFLAMVAFSAMEATLAFWGQDVYGWTQVETGYTLFYVGVVLVFVQGGAIGPLTKRFGPRPLLGVGLLGVAASLALIPVSTTLPVLLGTLALLAVTQGVANPTLSGFISLEASADGQGGAMGLLQSLQSLGRVIGPLVGTLLFQDVGRDVPYAFGAALTLVAAVAALVAARWAVTRRAPADREEEQPPREVLG